MVGQAGADLKITMFIKSIFNAFCFNASNIVHEENFRPYVHYWTWNS